MEEEEKMKFFLPPLTIQGVFWEKIENFPLTPFCCVVNQNQYKMKVLKLSIVAFSALLFFACGDSNSGTSNAPGAGNTEETAATEAEDHGSEDAGPIELNSGQRWLVNDEMKPYVTKGEELVNSFIQSGGSDFKALADQIKSQNVQLIKSCTMEGKSHDELHKWLHPHLELVKKLATEENADKQKVLVDELQMSYLKYHQYFN